MTDADRTQDDDLALDDEPVVHPGDEGEIPPARAIRRFTAEAGRSRAGASIGQLLGELYYAVVLTAIAVGVALGLAGALRTELPSGPGAAPVQGLSLPALVVVVVVMLAGALVSLAGRLGPVGVGGAEAAWWLGLPVDRRGLLRPAARRLPLLAAVAAGLLVGILDAGLAGGTGGRLLRVAGTAAAAGAGLVLLAALAQSAGVSRRATARVGEAVPALALLAAVGLALTGAQLGGVPSLPWPLLAALVVVVAGLAVLVDRRLGRMPGRTLREGGSVASQAVGAVVSLDSRELGRVLTDGAARPRRRRWVRFVGVRGPATALVTADLVVLRRSGRHVVQLVVTALVPLLVTLVPQLAGTAGVLLSVLVAGAVAVAATGEGARRAEMAPVLDRLLPLAASDVRRLRLVVPAGAMLLWSLVAFAAVGRWAGDVPGWLALAVAATPAWAAAAVRGAYRPSPDWGGPLVSTPMGALPTGVGAVIARGPDVLVLALLPVWVTLLLGTVHPFALGAQVLTSLIAVAVASSTDTRSLTQRMTDAADPTSAQAAGLTGGVGRAAGGR